MKMVLPYQLNSSSHRHFKIKSIIYSLRSFSTSCLIFLDQRINGNDELGNQIPKHIVCACIYHLTLLCAAVFTLQDQFTCWGDS
jgi:hypothetical protein